MRTRIITYILLLLSLFVSAQTKRALVIGLGEQQDKAWNKINGDKDVPLVQGMLKSAGFRSVTTLVNRQATKSGIVGRLREWLHRASKGMWCMSITLDMDNR